MPNHLIARPGSLLALDTSSGSCSVALWERGNVLAERMSVMERGQSEAIIPMAVAVLEEAHRAFADLDAFAVTRGPGSFTGVRIGLAAARALALACNRPCVGLSCFEVLAQRLRAEQHNLPGLVAIDSGRPEVFVQAFDTKGQALGEAACLLPEALASSLGEPDWLLTGNAAERMAPVLAAAGLGVRTLEASRAIAASEVARAAASKALPKAGAAMPTALYLRPADVSFPSKALLKAARRRI